MANGKKPVPGNTAPMPDNPELVGLKDNEKTLLAKIDRLKAMDYSKAAAQKFDIPNAVQRAESHLAEVRAEILRLTPKA